MSAAHSDAVANYYAFTRRAFGRLARAYDVIALFIAPLRRRVVAFSEAPPSARVLDVATGTGSQALAFARRGHDVVGIDLVPEMLAVAMRKRGAEGIRFVCLDAAHLTFPDATFDVCTVSFGLHEMPLEVREAAVAEMARVTRPGGTLVIADYGRPANPIWRALVVGFFASWESDAYREFVASDLDALLHSHGLVVEARQAPAGGAFQVVRARRAGDRSEG